MKEIIEELNNLKITQKSIDFSEDLSEDIYDKYFKNCVEEGLSVDKHRWYETSISVYKTDKGLLGVKSITDLFSEQSQCEDIFHTLEFFEMEEIPLISYKKKN